jgi:hypothetical protein
MPRILAVWVRQRFSLRVLEASLMSRILVLLLAVAVSASYAATAPPDDGHRRRFIAGAPDRLSLAGDRRLPRRHHRAESSVGAYADVDQVVDTPTAFPASRTPTAGARFAASAAAWSSTWSAPAVARCCGPPAGMPYDSAGGA